MRRTENMAPPEDWAEELCAWRDTSWTDDTDLIDCLYLSYRPGRDEDWEVDLDAVKTDLERGMWLKPGRSLPSGPRYYLSGEQYKVEVVSRPAEEGGWQLAVVRWIGMLPEGMVPRRTGRIAKQVRFTEVWDEYPCDISLFEREIDIIEQRRRARKTAVTELWGAHADADLAQHAELHAEARQRYGALRSLLRILAVRADETKVAREGVIVAPPPTFGRELSRQFLFVELTQQATPFDDMNIVMQTIDRSARTRVREVAGNLMTLELPSGPSWVIGESVTVTTVPRFTMKQHDIALERFLRADVEGDWDSLATLLCKPARLKQDPLPLPPRFYCDEDPDEHPLNDEQRRAVAGAIGALDTFFIQGPPGTGKTTVICETVRQLIGRGQRVLMVAPSHVAVDEVLRRIGRKPGIRALRLSWDDSKVDDTLHGFLPERASAEFAAALRRTGPAEQQGWEARRAGAAAELAAVERVLAALDDRRRVTEVVLTAESEELAIRDRLSEARERNERQTALLEQALVVATDNARVASARQDLAEEERHRLEQEFNRHRYLIDDILASAQAVASTRGELESATLSEADANQRLSAWHAEWAQRKWTIDRHLAEAEQGYGAATAAVTEMWTQLQQAEAAWRSLPQRPGLLRRTANTLGFGKGVRYRTAVERAHAVWVECDKSFRWWEQRRHAVLEGQEQLDDERRQTGGRLIDEHQRASSRRDEALAANQSASREWQRVSRTITGTSLHKPIDAVSAVDLLQAVLEKPGDTSPLPLGVAPSAVVKAHHRLVEATRQRDQAELDLAKVDTELTSANQALAGTRAAFLLEEGRLAGQLGDVTQEIAQGTGRLKAANATLADAMTVLGYRDIPEDADLIARQVSLRRQIRVLADYPDLEQRWFHLTEDLSEREIAAEIGDVLIRSVNVVCATTTGIAGMAGNVVRDVDFDTLIIDEASRVIDSEFLIGAVRAQRWVLVGDEHQLPPFVDQGDEYHLHALAALHRYERGVADTLETAANQLGDLWQEDDEQRQFRTKEVLETAQAMHDSEVWQDKYREIFAEAHGYFRGADPDRAFLAALREHLVRSLFERTVGKCGPNMRQALVMQRRMIPALAQIVKQPIYSGAYESPSEEDLVRCGVVPLVTSTFDKPVIFLDTSLRPDAKEQQVGHGFINALECEWVEKACLRYERELRDQDVKQTVSVSILCFYQAQATLIRDRLGAPGYPRFRRLSFNVIAPVDRIQGQESDLVFLTFSRSNPRPSEHFGKWLQDVRRLNVACTRAHRALVLVGNRQMLSRLRSSPQSREFYRNLLGLFDSSDDFVMMKDFLG
jgi:AAA domain